jgi:hypothetical protein
MLLDLDADIGQPGPQRLEPVEVAGGQGGKAGDELHLGRRQAAGDAHQQRVLLGRGQQVLEGLQVCR